MENKTISDVMRSLSHNTLEEIRISTVKWVVKAGECPRHLARTLGFSRATVYNWLRKFHDGGYDTLRAKPVPGRWWPKLSDDQIEWIRVIILAPCPRIGVSR